jgi:TolB-like protein
MMDAVWPGLAVEPNNLTVQVVTLRRILDEGGGESCIQTVPRRGYCFILRVTRAEREASPGPTLPALPSFQIELATRASSAPSPGSAVTSARTHDRRQSVIVLPFKNSGGDSAQDNLADEITNELTERVSRNATPTPVIPEMTAAAYRGREVDLQAIGRHHDVHFILVGSARRQDGRLMVSAILYEAAGGRNMWSRQFDRPDSRDAQQAIVQAIDENFWQASVDEEAVRAARERPDNLDQLDLVLMALATRLATPTKANYRERIALIGRALALDPNSLIVLERQARLHCEIVLLGYSSNPMADLTIAVEAADHMLMLDPNSLLSLRARAKVLHAQGSWHEAEAVLRRVIDLQPTEANRHYELGQILIAQGRHREALASFQAAKRFAGGSDAVYAYDAHIAMAALAIGQFAEAIAAARLSIAEFPTGTGRLGEFPWLALIAAESCNGQEDAARADLQKFLSTQPNCPSMAEIEKWPAFVANPKLLDGLRNAGMPDD